MYGLRAVGAVCGVALGQDVPTIEEIAHVLAQGALSDAAQRLLLLDGLMQCGWCDAFWMAVNDPQQGLPANECLSRGSPAP